jgi:hypothetical protein
LPHTFNIIGDCLSPEMIDFFNKFPDVKILNGTSPAGSEKTLGRDWSIYSSLECALQFPEDDWIYFCEDDYLHLPQAFTYIDDFIANKKAIMQYKVTSKDRLPLVVGKLDTKPLVIFPADYPDRYDEKYKRFSLIFLSKYCHWRQIDSTTHTFLTQVKTIKQFLGVIKKSVKPFRDKYLAKKFYGRFFVKKRALCVSPLLGLTTHMHSDVMSPFVNWEEACQHYKSVIE